MKNVDLIYDILDQAAMIHYEHLKIDYLSALTEINNNLNKNEYHSKLSDEVINNLEFLYKPIIEGKFLNEEIRLALQLYVVKGLKHINYPTNIMTPDFINYLYVVIINRLFKEQTISIIDTNLGTGNLLSTISNNYPGDAYLIGIENDLKLTEYASASMEIQQTEIKIYFQDALNKVLDRVDLVIGDLATYEVEAGLKLDNELYQAGIRYFPYLVIASRLENIQEDGYFIYLVDNDFFAYDAMGMFKSYIDKHASLVGLIALPQEIFLEKHRGKSIIIGKKTQTKLNELMAVEVSGLDNASLEKAINRINIMIDKIKEE